MSALGSVANACRPMKRSCSSNRAMLCRDPEDSLDEHRRPTTSPFASHFTCPLRIIFIASYPAIVRSAPSTDRNQRLAAVRFFTKRWSCSRNIVQVLTRPASAIPAQFAAPLLLLHRCWIGRMSVNIDHPRLDFIGTTERHLKEVLGGYSITLRRQQDINGFAAGIHRSI